MVFCVPVIAIRYELISSETLGEKDAGIKLKGLYDTKENPHNMTLLAITGRHYKFESEATLQKPGVTGLNVLYPGGEMDMFSFLRSNGFQKSIREDCSFKSESVEVCDCADRNIQAGLQSHSHIILDVYHGVEEHKVTSTLRCDLYSIPLSGLNHTPSDHDHEEL